MVAEDEYMVNEAIVTDKGRKFWEGKEPRRPESMSGDVSDNEEFDSSESDPEMIMRI